MVAGQSSTFVDGKLWAVQGDPNSHGAGALIPTVSSVLIQGKAVIVNSPDPASADNLCPTLDGEHCTPKTAGGSGTTYAGG